MGDNSDADRALELRILLDAANPPAGALGRRGDDDLLPFAGWVSLIGAIKAVTSGDRCRSGDGPTTTANAREDP